MKSSHPIFRVLPIAAACFAAPALATIGYFAHGYGIMAKGMEQKKETKKKPAKTMKEKKADKNAKKSAK